MNSGRYWNWRIAVIASIGAPFSVLLHELAHVGALELGGVAAHLHGFSMGMPIGYFWNFEGLENAKSYFGVPGSVFVIAALAGPITTLGIAYGGLLGYRWTQAPVFWASGFAAILLRMVGGTLNMPRFTDGSMDTSDEAIAAHFVAAPLSSFYWPSLLLGYRLHCPALQNHRAREKSFVRSFCGHCRCGRLLQRRHLGQSAHLQA